MISDQTINQFQEGCENAFAILYDHFYDRLRFLAYGYVKDYFRAEEITLDQLRKLWNGRANFACYISIKAFLMTCTRNACIDEIRKRNMAVKSFENWKKEEGESELSNDTKLTSIIRQEILEEIIGAAEKLPCQCKQVFYMYFLHDKKANEISQILKIHVSTVRTQKARALILLRKSLELRKYSLYN